MILPTWSRYLLLQLPGLVLVVLALAVLRYWGWVTDGVALAALLLWICADALLYPLYRVALEKRASDPGPAGHIGVIGECRTAIDGRGLVEVAGERWLARSRDGDVIAAGARVRVVGHDGMELIVCAVDAI